MVAALHGGRLAPTGARVPVVLSDELAQVARVEAELAGELGR